MSRSTRILLSAVLLLGTGFLWVFGQYGWASPKTVGAAVVALLLMLVINLGEVRARAARRRAVMPTTSEPGRDNQAGIGPDSSRRASAG